ncbi:MAG: tRNA cyclic N6-threonylcarbamoyladenosine(37) synthase TcdA [Thiopseudomonas sp.]
MDTQRFGGIARLYGEQGLQRLQQAHVAVIGIGGVGSWAAEALVRSGIGEVTLVDLDDICVTNTNRQAHTLGSTLGQLKVDVMAERLLAINPACKVHPVADFIATDNLAELLHGALDYVIDCIDSLVPKAALIAWCKRQKIPLITTGGAGGQVDPTQVMVADLNKTYHDPLAARLRTRLKKEHGFTRAPKKNFGVPCVFSSEQLRYPTPDGRVCSEKGFVGEGVKLDCAGGFGAAMTVTATFGLVAASRALTAIADGKGRPGKS